MKMTLALSAAIAASLALAGASFAQDTAAPAPSGNHMASGDHMSHSHTKKHNAMSHGSMSHGSMSHGAMEHGNTTDGH